MKRNIFYLSVLVVIISFILSTKIVDKISFERSYYAFFAYNDKNSESVVITIENSQKINNIDNKQFFSSLDQCAVNNDLIIHALVYNTSGSNDYNLYISSNDTAVQENLMLKKGYAKNSENIVTMLMILIIRYYNLVILYYIVLNLLLIVIRKVLF